MLLAGGILQWSLDLGFIFDTAQPLTPAHCARPAQLIFTLFLGVLKYTWDELHQSKHIYLLPNAEVDWSYLPIGCVTFLLLLSYVVPISLFVAIEGIKLIQKFFMVPPPSPP